MGQGCGSRLAQSFPILHRSFLGSLVRFPSLDPNDKVRRTAGGLPYRMLVFGSSVSVGSGSSDGTTRGWTAQLACASREQRGVECEIRGIPGTNSGNWLGWLQDGKIDRRHLHRFSVIVLSLSLGNEGLSSYSSDAEVAACERRFVDNLRSATEALRDEMLPGAWLVLGGPYPNNRYEEALHLPALRRTLQELRQWPHVDYVVDFLDSEVHDGRGHWSEGAWSDAGHPNDVGHSQMFRCAAKDLANVLGPLW